MGEEQEAMAGDSEKATGKKDIGAEKECLEQEKEQTRKKHSS